MEIGGAAWETRTSVPGGPGRGERTMGREGGQDSMRIHVRGAGDGTSKVNVLSA